MLYFVIILLMVGFLPLIAFNVKLWKCYHDDRKLVLLATDNTNDLEIVKINLKLNEGTVDLCKIVREYMDNDLSVFAVSNEEFKSKLVDLERKINDAVSKIGRKRR